MNPRKTAWIVVIALLGLVLVLALRFVPRSEPDQQVPVANSEPGTKPRQKPVPHLVEEQLLPSEAAPLGEVSKTKLAERDEGLSIRDLEKHGIFVEAEQVGKNSASGKVRVTAPGGAVLEADRAKMSSSGMLVAEGNPVMVKGEMRANVGGENGAMAIYFDEEKQSVIMRAGAADKVTDKSIDDSNVTDPDRGNLAPASEE